MGDIVTDFFDVEEGVKQGCVLSPIFFCLYINELSKMLDKHVQCNVKMGDIVTDFFDVEEGVKQGCVLSPIFFCLYINELSKMLCNE